MVTILIITLPKTKKIPFHHGRDDDGKNITNFPYFFRKVLLSFANLKEVKLVNMWPWSPGHLLKALKAEKDEFVKKGTPLVAPKLKLLDFGFLGFNVLKDDFLEFLATGFFRYVEKIELETRMGIDDCWSGLVPFANETENLSNVYWEGRSVKELIDDNPTNPN